MSHHSGRVPFSAVPLGSLLNLHHMNRAPAGFIGSPQIGFDAAHLMWRPAASSTPLPHIHPTIHQRHPVARPHDRPSEPDSPASSPSNSRYNLRKSHRLSRRPIADSVPTLASSHTQKTASKKRPTAVPIPESPQEKRAKTKQSKPVEKTMQPKQKVYKVGEETRRSPNPRRSEEIEELAFYTLHHGSLVSVPSIASHSSISERGIYRQITFEVRLNALLSLNVVPVLRFFREPKERPARIQHPRNLEVRLNETTTVIAPQSVDHRDIEKETSMAPIELKLRPGLNTVTVIWTELRNKQDYSLDVVLAGKRSVEVAVEMIQRRTAFKTHAIRRAYESLNDNDENDIVSEGHKLRLTCCLSRSRLELPIRGTNCRHLECFDAKSYLAMNKTLNAKWRCPYCNERAHYSDLIVDKFVQDVLSSFSGSTVELNARAMKVQVKEIKENPPTPDSEQPAKRIKKVVEETIVIDD